MDILSNELITIILSYLSQKQLARASLVCKKWYQLTLCPTFYNTIHIYSVKQLEKFLEFANTKKTTENSIPIGHFVHRFFYYGDSLSPSLYLSLNDICPNIVFINEISLNNYTSNNNHNNNDNDNLVIEKESHQQQQWHRLKHINTWYSKIYTNWMDHIKNNINTLQLQIDKSLLNQQSITKLSSSSSSSSSALSSSASSASSMIHFKKDNPPKLQRNRILIFYMDDDDIREHQKSMGDTSIEGELNFRNHLNEYISRTIHNIYNNNNNNNNNNNINNTTDGNNELYDFYGQVLTLPTSWIHLSSLYIDFCDLNCSQLTPICGIDERSFNTIMDSCPSLVSLGINCMDMVISTGYDRLNILPCFQLLHLEIKHSNIQDPLCYEYFSTKLPNLNTFNLVLQTSKLYPPNKYPAFKDAIYNMIIQYKNLKSLTIGMDEQDFYRYNKFNSLFWPIKELNGWLKEHPHQIQHLDTWFEFIRDHDHPHQMKYLDHLITLSLANITELPSTVLYHRLLLNKDHPHYVSTSITVLKLKNASVFTTTTPAVSKAKNEPVFELDDWLKAFPNLRELSLKRIGFITSKNGDQLMDIGDDDDHHHHQKDQQKHQHQYKKGYPLEILDICQSDIRIKGGLSTLCHLFPKLRALYLTTVCFLYDYSLMDVDTKDHYNEHLSAIVIDAGQLNLDELEIYHVNFLSSEDDDDDTAELIEFLTVKENIYLEEKCYGCINASSVSSHHLYFKCNSVERIIF